MRILTWTTIGTDSVFSGLATPGLVPANGTQVGQLVSNSGKGITEVCYSVVPQQTGKTFDPSQVLLAICNDIDGTKFATPRVKGSQGRRLGPIYQSVGQVGTIGEFDGTENILSGDAAAFRVSIYNGTGIPLIVTIYYKQGE